MYSHPIGMNGHGAGPLIGLWDYQDGVPGRGDAKVIPTMWFSIELQATTPGAGVGRPAGADGAGGGHDRRRDGGPRWALAAARRSCSLVRLGAIGLPHDAPSVTMQARTPIDASKGEEAPARGR